MDLAVSSNSENNYDDSYDIPMLADLCKIAIIMDMAIEVVSRVPTTELKYDEGIDDSTKTETIRNVVLSTTKRKLDEIRANSGKEK